MSYSRLKTENSRLLLVAGVLVLATATLLAYWPAIHGGFLFDDDAMVTGSALVKASDGLRRMWFTTEAVDYWPLTNSSLWFEWRLWGSDPTGYHLTNICLHIGSALVLWSILRRLQIPGAWAGAMLFALHPVNVQSVAWIAQRKNTLSLLCFLLSITAFLRVIAAPPDQKTRGSNVNAPGSLPMDRWYWLSLAAFVLAMLSKGSVAILPGVLLLLIWWIRDRVRRTDLLRIAPFFLIAVALTLVNVWFQRRMPGSSRGVTPVERLLGAGAVIWFYLSKALVPWRLAFVYPQMNVSSALAQWWLPGTAALGVTAGLFWQRRRPFMRALLFAWLFFCVSLLPVMGLTDVYFMIYSLVADHYQYIAMLAVVTCAAAGLGRWFWGSEVPGFLGSARFGFRGSGVLVLTALLATFGTLTWKQAHLYASGETLYRATLARNPDAWPIENNLGALLLERDADEEALQHLRHALSVNPDFRQVHNNLCNALARLRMMQEALAECRLALSLDPDRSVSHSSLGLALASLGQLPEARTEFETALRLNPGSVQAHSGVGEVLLAMDQPAEAARHFLAVLAARPDSVSARVGLGRVHLMLADVLLEQNRVGEALGEYRQALTYDAQSAEAHNNLGVALARAGQIPEAIDQFQTALRLDPGFTDARDNLTKVSSRRPVAR